ncbi:MAG: N-methylhydantoinase [Thermoleophilaceae bacterium]|nr:N-methylhydantoinase [Thermoleophilaceae bacterium]
MSQSTVTDATAETTPGTVHDPITMEVLRHGFRGVCNEASALLARVAYAATITEGHDYSGSLLTADGRLVAHGTKDQAAHLGTFEDSLAKILEFFPTPSPGDVYIFNDPYDGGSHQPDVKVVRPLFHGEHLLAYGISCGHWPDVGGPVPGTFNPQATSCYAEGLRIPPTLLLVRGERVESTFQLLRANVRQPDERMADLHAQIQATRLMEDRMAEYADQFGVDTIETAMSTSMDRSRHLLREAIGRLPDGTYSFTDYGDMDYMHPDRPRIKVHLDLTISGSEALFDFSESDDAPIGVFGFARPALVAAVCDGTMHCFPDLKPLNHGVTSSLRIEARPGSCVDVQEPTPVTGYASGAYEKVAAIVMACWAQAFTDVDTRRQHAATINLANLVISGKHPQSGGDSVAYLWNEGGQGARSYKDGNSYMLMIFIGGATNQPIEVLERIIPIRYTKCEVAPASCGHGKYRGGFGIDRSFEAVQDLVLTMHGDRQEVTPFGLAGGRNGGPNVLVLNSGTAEERSLGMDTAGLHVSAGTQLFYCSNGGGGFGFPHERPVELVLGDLRAEYIDANVAEEVYGVVLDEDGTVDDERTRAARERLAAAEPDFGLGPDQTHPMGASVRLIP